MLACVNACFFPFRHYSWQTVHGLLLLPPEAVWRCAYISQLSQGWYLIFMDSYIIVVSFSCFYDTVHLTLSAFWSVKVYLVFMLLLGFFLQGYFYNDDTFNFNYAQAKAALGNYKEAEEVFHLSKKKEEKSELCSVLLSHLIDTAEFLKCTTVPYSFSCLFRVRRWRTTTFTSAGWPDAVRVVSYYIF